MKNWITRVGAGLVATTAALLVTGTAAVAAPAPQAGPQPLIGTPCATGRVCVFDGAHFTGKRYDYYRCGTYDVRSVGLTRVGSFVNNQTGNQVATFSGPDDTGRVVPQFTSTAVDAESDTTGRTTWIVKPC